jgi:hypothetical protein
VGQLRKLGHEVYDFRGGGDGWNEADGRGGFAWSEVDPDWQEWPKDVQRYLFGLQHPRAVEGFDRDMDALRSADICVAVMPFGPSASMEMGWAVGAGKPTAVWTPAIREPDLMVKMANWITADWSSIEFWLETAVRGSDPVLR